MPPPYDLGLSLQHSQGFIDLVVGYMKLDPKTTWTEAAARAANDVLRLHRKQIYKKLSNV
jgi:hypothetical protein